MMQKHSLNLRQKNMRNARVCADYARFQRARTDLRGRTRLEIDSYNSDPGLVPPNRRSIDRLAALSLDPDYFLKALEEQDRFDD